MSSCNVPSCPGYRGNQDGDIPLSSNKKGRSRKSSDFQEDSAKDEAQSNSNQPGPQTNSAKERARADSVQEDRKNSVRHRSQESSSGRTSVVSPRRRKPSSPNFLVLIFRKIRRTVNNASGFWRKVREDRFRWQLFTSILFFTLGLKLFDDLARHTVPIATVPIVVPVVTSSATAAGTGLKTLAQSHSYHSRTWCK